MITPDVREQALPADDLARVANEVEEKTELAVGELGDNVPELCLPAGELESQRPGPKHAAVLVEGGATELRPDPREQLVEREGLRDVVARAEAEAAQLRLEVGARVHDHDRKFRAFLDALRWG